MKWTLITSGILLLLVSASCRTGKSASDNPEQYRQLAEEKYGGGVEYLFNSTRTAVLCVHRAKQPAQSLQQPVAFMVFDLSSSAPLFEDAIPDGSVAWKDDATIVVRTVPGIEKADPKPEERIPGYTYDIRTRKIKQLGVQDVR